MAAPTLEKKGVDGRVKHGHDGVGGWVIGNHGWYYSGQLRTRDEGMRRWASDAPEKSGCRGAPCGAFAGMTGERAGGGRLAIERSAIGGLRCTNPPYFVMSVVANE